MAFDINTTYTPFPFPSGLRDRLAAAVITGLMANEHTNDFTAEKFALNAYAVADAMLKARSKTPKETE